MSTTAPGQATPSSGPGGEQLARKCLRCGLAYAPGKSTSELRLTYCSFLCELGHLGFSISGLEHMQRTADAAETEPDHGEQGEPEAETASEA